MCFRPAKRRPIEENSYRQVSQLPPSQIQEYPLDPPLHHYYITPPGNQEAPCGNKPVPYVERKRKRRCYKAKNPPLKGGFFMQLVSVKCLCGRHREIYFSKDGYSI